jgi:hypothetical protein
VKTMVKKRRTRKIGEGKRSPGCIPRTAVKKMIAVIDSHTGKTVRETFRGKKLTPFESNRLQAMIIRRACPIPRKTRGRGRRKGQIRSEAIPRLYR